jgi:uncharacterized protein YndB with AHSA1/START domain
MTEPDLDAASATLLDAEGRWTLRFERHFAHPIERVWRAVAEPADRDAWFPQRIEGDLVAGGPLRFVDDPNAADDGFDGRCLRIEPPHLLELAWGEDVLRIELTPNGDGTRLVFLDTVGDRPHAARTASGWHHCLNVLAATLAGADAPEMDEERWDEIHEHYLAALGGERHVWGEPPA